MRDACHLLFFLFYGRFPGGRRGLIGETLKSKRKTGKNGSNMRIAVRNAYKYRVEEVAELSGPDEQKLPSQMSTSSSSPEETA